MKKKQQNLISFSNIKLISVLFIYENNQMKIFCVLCCFSYANKNKIAKHRIQLNIFYHKNIFI
jgi:hypothetical protein